MYKGVFIRPLRGMHMRKWIVVAAALVFGVLFISSALASLAQFQGTWANIDSGITKLKVDVSGSEVGVQAWGKCHPIDCDWGTVEGVAFAPSVDSNLINDANVIQAVFTESFKRTTLVLTIAGNRLDVLSLNEFTDSSGRTNYASDYTLSRASFLIVPVTLTGGDNQELALVPGEQIKIKLKSWKGDYLHRPDTERGVTTWDTVAGNEWILEMGENGKVMLESWKGDYLHRPDTERGVTTWDTGVGNEWIVEVITNS